jgi:hypothetical protein
MKMMMMMMIMIIIIIIIIIAKIIIMKGQSYARKPSICHLLLLFVSTTKITTFIYTMIIKIRNKPQGFLPTSDPNRKKTLGLIAKKTKRKTK